MSIIYIILGLYVIYYAFNILYDLSQNSKKRLAAQTTQTIDVKKLAETKNTAVDLSNGTSAEEVHDYDQHEDTFEEVEDDYNQDAENQSDVDSTDLKKKN